MGVFGYKRSRDGFEGPVVDEAGEFFLSRVLKVYGKFLFPFQMAWCDGVRVEDGCVHGR